MTTAETVIEFLKVTYERFTSTTSKYWRRVIAIGLTIGAIGGSLVAAGDILSEDVRKVAQFMVVIGITASAVAKSTTDDNALVKKSEDILTKDSE